MKEDHKRALKKMKQQILSFCLCHNYRFCNTKRQVHFKCLRALKPKGLYAEILQEYLLTYDNLIDKVERFDKCIEELASNKTYQENVRKMSYFTGVKTVTAFPLPRSLRRTSDLTPEEDSSSGYQKCLGITKAGNCHVRCLLVEAAQSYICGQIGFKSKALNLC